MTFKMQSSGHSYWWPVSVSLPDPDKPGKFTTQSFEMHFRPMPWDESNALARKVAQMPADEQAAHQHDELLAVSIGWRKVVDEKDAEVPFSPETLKQAMQHSWFSQGVQKAYIGSLVSA